MILGRMTDDAPYVSDYTYKNIYYKSILEKTEDYLTIKDYIWRWDTDWFWCSVNMGAQNPILRRVYGKDRLRSDRFMKIFNFEMRHGYKQKLDKLFGKKPIEFVIQDVELPIENCEKFIDYYFKTINILPVWVCPVKQLDVSKNWSLYNSFISSCYILC